MAQSPLKTIAQVIGLQAALDDRIRGIVGDTPPVNPPANYLWIRTPDVTKPNLGASFTVTGGSGTLTAAWSAATDNIGVTGYRFWYGLSSGFTSASISDVTGLGVTVSVASGTYYCRLQARDAAGNYSDYSSTVTAVASVGIVTAGLLLDLRASNSNVTKTAAHLNSDSDATTWYDMGPNSYNFIGTGFPNPPTSANGWSSTSPYALVLPGPNASGGVMSSSSNRAPFSITGNMTLEMIVKVNRSATSSYGLVAYGNNGNTFAYELDFGDTTQGVRFLLGSSTTAWVTWQNPIASAFPGATWAVVSVSLSANVPTLYINGSPVSWVTNPTYSGTRQPLDTVNHPLYLANGSSASSVLNGSVGEARIYNAALSAADVLQNYNARKAVYGLA